MAFGSSNQGVELSSANYWYIKGIRIRGAGDNGMLLDNSGNNVIEFCDFFENRDAGFQLKNKSHNNQIINCDAYFNADYDGTSAHTGGNADGFSPKLDIGAGNYFYGCRSWLNSDDGWDGLLYSDCNITTTIENCWAWKNGYLKDGTTTTSNMNGNGFKMGGGWTTDANGVKHYTFRHNQILKNCLVFMNKAKGYDQNHNFGSMTLLNCTAFGNNAYNFAIGEKVDSASHVVIKNCVSYEQNSINLFNGVEQVTNSWLSLNISSSDFASIDTTGVSAPRKSDGSLPDIAFMHLSSQSKLIDAGTNIGLPFAGSAPDLGCFEYKGISSVENKAIAKDFAILTNYPNPFNPSTIICYSLQTAGTVELKIFDVMGREIATLVNSHQNAGSYKVNFDASKLSSGTYIYRIKSGSYIKTAKMLLVK